jgi:ubiquinone/menaquinone biosynthesis C-methylase UbiE
METRAALIEGYSRAAPVYDQTAGMLYLSSLRRYLLPRVSVGPMPAVLDLGCGTGINLLEVARALGVCRRLHGIDLAPGMIEEARRKATAAGVTAVFELGDAQDLAFEEASFDLVICNSVYHWLVDRPRAIAEMSRVVRPGGQVLVSSIVEPGYHEWVRAVDDVRGRFLREPRHEKGRWMPPMPTTAELMSDLRASGLSIEYLVYEVEPFAVQDAGAFVQLMSVVAPTWLAGVPDGSSRDAMTAATEALSRGATGPLVVTAAGVATVSRKPLP